MKQVYSADSPLFWEEDVEGPKLDCSNLAVADLCRSTEPSGGETLERSAADWRVRNNCLSVCTFASRLVLNNLLPSRLARHPVLTQTRTLFVCLEYCRPFYSLNVMACCKPKQIMHCFIRMEEWDNFAVFINIAT